MPNSEIYLDASRYESLVAALVEASTRPDPFTGKIADADQIRIALGEAADIWPESVTRDGAVEGIGRALVAEVSCS